ncbi:CtsR family transcriptional regulator [Salinicoccus sp. YB14-2]|uniref:CtsR family transcriptional regulator n=1 Tax=Salinicoccus sp. YB14-2 TaxID=1572701 RepID=UPI0006914A28|nr:CtsR family transcriptional regulator [Salinicoccus sp. YB14-2]
MRNMSDIIEQYLKELLAASDGEGVEIKRAFIAEKFDCVPSQLNYVIKTRFTNEHGYMVESKRGGGGYIRITKVETHSKSEYLAHLKNLIGHGLSQQNAQHIVQSMFENDVITLKEGKIINAALDRESLMIELPFRDQLRAKILLKIIDVILYTEE